MNLDAKRQAEQRRIAAQLGEIGFALPGSLTVKAYRCIPVRQAELPMSWGPPTTSRSLRVLDAQGEQQDPDLR
jgi:hypothetical protein